MLKYCVGMIGTPAYPETSWSGSKLEELKRLGFNAMQLNIAWGCRPNDEPLNVEDVLVLPGQTPEVQAKAAKRRERIRSRLKLCKAHNMRAIFHFGAPFNGQGPYFGEKPKNCISDIAITEKYTYLLEELNVQIPGINDILVYTYDQDAWLCSEFSSCKNCRGIPLDQRLPHFLTALCDKWREIRADGILWWESWELSAGQVLKIAEKLPTENFGLMAHSNTGEVQKTRAVDLWFQNLAAIAKKRGIPLVAELFLGESSEETEPLKRIPCPRLTYTQIKAVLGVPGVTGIKEYYGLLPETGDPCLNMVGETLKSFDVKVEAALAELAKRYKEAAADMVTFWELVAEGYMLYPWDVSWYAREVGRSCLDHGWHAAFLRGQQCSTPSWESTRHAIFMKTDNSQPHPWMLEDIQLRCELSADRMKKAMAAGKKIIKLLSGSDAQQMEESLESIDMFCRICTGYVLHLRETNVAMLLREDEKKGNPLPEFLLQELSELLKKDVENQHEKGRVVKIQKEFEENAREWLHMYLVPTETELQEKGPFSLTTR